MKKYFLEIYNDLIGLSSDIADRKQDISLTEISGLRERLKEKDGIFEEVILYALEEAEKLVNDSDFVRAHDLIDSVHYLPKILSDYLRNMTAYWDIFISYYEEKWDTDFFEIYKDRILNMKP